MKRFACTLTPENYDTACDLAGSALLRRIPAASTILQITEGGAWDAFPTGIYIAADFENVIRYTGSAIRDGSIGDRVQEHVLSGRAARWTRLMAVPLAADTEEDLVRRIEGRIGAVLRPIDTKRLPTFGGPRRPAQRRASR
ncbi:hypothetical protein ADK41_15385 [Streptomyces caelestis]|uniref:GIY-YIG domain-containing protein n=1 Tax=Streptomyces caelestis TaxID=36816 RepID=A0A0M8QSC4_9ACTN|nr:MULTISPECIES: hypothetical protein [Streptomyces]KOT38864.1 hypothetical protein ADK41_15385 [Streptomyces caelestis]